MILYNFIILGLISFGSYSTSPIRSNGGGSASFDGINIYAKGAMKNCYLGTYKNGERKGQRCVVKFMKDSSCQREDYADEMKIFEW